MSAAPIVFPTRAALMQAAADEIAAALRAGLRARGQACAALSGGSTPEPAYALLARQALDWPKIAFALVDERYVPPAHAASNEGMLRRALAPALAQGAQLAPLFSDAPTLEDAARRADALYAPMRFDIALMGMGDDGHTASWFDGAEGMDVAYDPAAARTVVAIHAPQAAGSAERLTLTYAAIARIPRLVLVTTGAEKRARLLKAANGDAVGPVSKLFQLPDGALKALHAD